MIEPESGEATRDDEPPQERPWLFCLLALAVVAAVYVQVVGGPFIWDDRPLILESEGIRKLDFVRFFSEPLWAGKELQSAAYFRPLVALSFALDYQLHGDNSGGYHLTNLLWHLLATGLLFGLLRRRRVSLPLSFVLATAWALLPRLTEGAAWISGRADVMATVWTLLALVIYRPFASAPRLAATGLAAFLAIACKETGLAAFVGLALSLWFDRGGSVAEPRARAWPGWLALGVPLGAYFVLRGTAGAWSLGETLRLSVVDRSQAVIEAVGRYVWMLIDFWQPRSYHGLLGRPDWRFIALGFGALVALAAFARRILQTAPETRVLLAMAGTALGLVLHVLPLPISTVAADRYLYLPLAALVLAVGPWLDRRAQSRRALVLAPVALLLLGGARTFQRAGDYTDEGQFWAAAVRDSPEHALALAELGSVAYRAGCLPEALEIYLQAVDKGDGRSSIPLENAALLAAINGHHPLAAQLGDRLLRAFPGRAELELRRAVVALAALDFTRARAHALRAQQLEPGDGSARAFVELLDEVQRDGVEARRSPSNAARAMSLAVRTQQFREVAALVERELDTGAIAGAALRDGLELLVAKGDPLVVEPLLARYAARPDAVRPAPLVAALRDRSAAAAGLRERLRALSASGALRAES